MSVQIQFNQHRAFQFLDVFLVFHRKHRTVSQKNITISSLVKMRFRDEVVLNFPYQSYVSLMCDDKEDPMTNHMIVFDKLYYDKICGGGSFSHVTMNGWFHEMAIIIYELRDMFKDKDTFAVVMQIREDLIEDLMFRCSVLGFVPTSSDHEEVRA